MILVSINVILQVISYFIESLINYQHHLKFNRSIINFVVKSIQNPIIIHIIEYIPILLHMISKICIFHCMNYHLIMLFCNHSIIYRISQNSEIFYIDLESFYFIQLF
jgi:hypothetical protein